IPKIGSSLKQDISSERGIDQSKAHGWKKGGLTKGEIRICENITARGMAEYGYTPSDTNYHYSELFYYLIFPFQLILTLIFNVRKTRSLISAIRKRFLY
ncbi:MAG: hypothetical protein HKO56_00630, partial [Bacteroidia bacterium]|nr:hypothetical protein [Bacteroidia bacterium]